ncbi:MAG: outer membrane lipoprotein chaperone LolA [Gammaproteobacteria bacterium]|nr:outer membrane lipoprotein chaperone LolA [Gammaproteobacteria bacterium]
MKRLTLLGSILCCSLLCSGMLMAQTARAQLERFSQGLETFHAQFEQKVTGTDGVTEDSSSGEVWLSRPGLFRWEYGGEFPEVVVADGTRIWIYDKVLDQVTVKSQSAEAADSPLNLLTDIGQLDRQFEVREAGDNGQMQFLELRPLNSEKDFERILLGLGNDSLQLMVMEDAFGLRTEITFSGTQRNLVLEPALFRFEPPESADVIGDIQR